MLGPSILRRDEENYRSDTQQTKLPARQGGHHFPHRTTLYPCDCDAYCDVGGTGLIAACLQASYPAGHLGPEDDNS
jgi:hypothetical protein